MSDVIAANTQQNTPSRSDLDAMIAADEAEDRQPASEAKADTPEPQAEETTTHDADTEASQPEPTAADDDDDETAVHKRIARLAHAEREQRRQLAALRAENERLKGQAPPLPRDEELQHQVQQRVAAELAAAEHNRKANQIYADGVKAFPDFDTQLSNLRSIGGLSPEIIEAAAEAGDAHKIFAYLGKNLDVAERIMSLQPAAQGAALARINAKVNTPTPKPVSKAPPPIKPVSGQAAPAEREDNLSMEDEMKLVRDRRFSRRR